MKVNPNQSSGIPAPAQEAETNVKDGTSNTIAFGESSKPEKPFAKDSFESFRFEMAGLPCSALDASSKDAAKLSVIKSPRDAQSVMVPRGETTTPNVQDEIDIETKKLELRDEKVIENLNVKYTLFLPEE
jgi:hypothetical protein